MEDYLSTCRTCLQKSDELTSLHSKDNDTGLTLLEKLRHCASMQFPVSENMPFNACAPCVRRITEFYDFKQRCELSEKTLEELCNDSIYTVSIAEVFLNEGKEECDDSAVVAKTEPEKSDFLSDDDSIWTPLSGDVDDDTMEEEQESGNEHDQDKDEPTFAFETCDKRSENEEELSTHVKTCAKEEPVKQKCSCQLCNKEFKSPSLLESHMLTHSEECSLVCKRCKRTFESEHDLRRHSRRHFLEKRRCDCCCELFNSLSEMLEHRTSTHPHLDPYDDEAQCRQTCGVCKKTFSSWPEFLSHSAEHKPGLFRRKLRAREFQKQKSDLEPLEQKFGSSKGKPQALEPHLQIPDLEPIDETLIRGQLDNLTPEHKHPCDRCLGYFTSAAHLRRHKNACHTMGLHRCDQCGSSFTSGYSLRHHMKKHKQYSKYICETCGRVYTFEESLRLHILEHHGVEKPVYKCRWCGKEYNILGSLNSHERTHRVYKLRFKCDRCEKAFAIRSRLKRHVKAIHDKPHACDTCDKRFECEAYLVKHRATHVREMEKPLACELCQKRFSKKAALTFHMSTQHQGKKHLKCDVCGMEFYNRFHFAAHYSGHTGIKPYKCNGCGNGYKYNKSLMEHKKKCAALLELSGP